MKMSTLTISSDIPASHELDMSTENILDHPAAEQLFQTFKEKEVSRLQQLFEEKSSNGGLTDHETLLYLGVPNVNLSDLKSVLDGSLQVEPANVPFWQSVIDAFYLYWKTGESYTRVVFDVQANQVEPVDADLIENALAHVSRDISGKVVQTRNQLYEQIGLGDLLIESDHAKPKITGIELGNPDLQIAESLNVLKEVPVLAHAHVATGKHIDYDTPVNKRKIPFAEIDECPFDVETFDAGNWVGVPLAVGSSTETGSYIMVYLPKNNWKAMVFESGLLNLFTLVSHDEIETADVEGVLFIGDESKDMDSFGFHHLNEGPTKYVGMVPGLDELMYFGYAKKPILTLHNILEAEKGRMPVHCSAMHYEVEFDENGAPSIKNTIPLADDMGSFEVREVDGVERVFFYGTEEGGFGCLDSFSDELADEIEPYSVGYNGTSNSNARRVHPVTSADAVRAGYEVDLFLVMNNYELRSRDESKIDVGISVEDAFDHWTNGKRVAAGSTGTERGKIELSTDANPFPVYQMPEAEGGEVVNERVRDLILPLKSRLQDVISQRVATGEMEMGVAYSQLMSGVCPWYNTDEKLAEKGYSPEDREHFEGDLGPNQLADDTIQKVLKMAVMKRQRYFDQHGIYPEQVGITEVDTGDSRTGKSEKTQKMAEKLNLSFIGNGRTEVEESQLVTAEVL